MSSCDAVLSRSVMSDSLWPLGPHQAPLSLGFSRQEYWTGLPSLPPGDLPNPGVKPRSLALQVDSLPAEPPGKPKNTGMGSLSLLQGIFPIQGLNGVLCIRGRLFTSWATREEHSCHKTEPWRQKPRKLLGNAVFFAVSVRAWPSDPLLLGFCCLDRKSVISCPQPPNWSRKWQPTPVFLPRESCATEEPGGLLSMGLHRMRHNWSD